MKETVTVAQVATASETVLPVRVQEALGELVGAAKEGLLALSVGVGLGVLAELMEEEVKVCAVLRPGFSLAPEELVAWCEGRMARHMVPRFIRVMDELPKTPTAKVEKHILRAEGLTADTWDRERAGVSIRRKTL